MAYYSSETCGYVNNSRVETGCTTDYAQSEVKYAVDAWAADKFQSIDLSVDETGYSARLITFDELLPNLGYNWSITSQGLGVNPAVNSDVPDWVYNSNYAYWTMSPDEDSALDMWGVNNDGVVTTHNVYNDNVVRPVVTLLKSAL